MELKSIFVLFCIIVLLSGCEFSKKSYKELDVSSMKTCFNDEDCVLVTNAQNGCCQIPISLYKDFVDGYYDNYAQKIVEIQQSCREKFNYGMSCKIAKYEPACINYTCHVIDKMMFDEIVG